MRLPIRVTHVIPSLDVGGAETMLHRLLKTMSRDSFASHVITLQHGGHLAGDVAALGVPLESLGGSAWRDFLTLPRLVGMLRRSRPDVIQTWLYRADLVGGLAASTLARRPPVIWGIRTSSLEAREVELRTRLLVRTCAVMSHRLPERIVLNSATALEHHVGLGYPRERMEVIPNGLDTEIFRPSPEIRRDVRAEWGLSEELPVLGMIGRFHPLKNHRGFVAAAKIVARYVPAARFVLCGQGVDAANVELVRWIAEAGLSNRALLLGPRKDIARMTCGLDVAASPSITEGFPNAVIEAMACGVPTVVTDVGECSAIVGDTGIPVAVRDDEAFARACVQLLSLSADQRRALGERARQRVCERFSIEQIAAKYEALYERTATPR